MHASVFFILVLYLLSSPSNVKASKTPSGFTIDLIHRDSPLSPFYNSSKSLSELITNAALRSNSRINRLSLSLLQQNKNESLESIVIPNGGDYLMRIYIGTPPVERLAIADTGSDLTWVQCSPCMNCFRQDTPLYDKTKSSTFANVSCISQPCTLLPPNQKYCGSSKECLYAYSYGDTSFTVGELGVDDINFGSNNNIKFPKSIFGCGYYNRFTFDSSGRTTGLVGLGAGPLSLVSQLGDSIGRKFSYCLLPFSSTTTSKMKFGKDSIISGKEVVSTPLIINSSNPTFYFLNLEGITIGKKRVNTGQTDGNIIIDSGTTLTYLEPNFFNDFVTSLKESIGVEATEVEDLPSPFHFCFTYRAGMSFPDVVLHFTGANVTLKPKNLLFKLVEKNMLCLAVIPSNYEGISIFGNVAQIDFQVEYDLGGRKLSFAPTDCTKI